MVFLEAGQEMSSEHKEHQHMRSNEGVLMLNLQTMSNSCINVARPIKVDIELTHSHHLCDGLYTHSLLKP